MSRIATTVWMLVLVLQVFIAGLGSWVWLDWHNTLASNGHWVVEKRNLALAVMGSEQYYFDRQSLAGGALDLGSWHGFHQVTYSEQIDARQIHINFDMAESSYVYFLLGCQLDSCYSLRLSTNRAYRNAWINLKHSGEFLSEEPIKTVRLKATNNTISFLTNQDRSEIGVIVNGQYYGHFPVQPFYASSFGFRSGLQSVRINQVEVFDHQGKRVLFESFDNQKDLFSIALRVYAVLLLVDASLLLLEMRLKRPNMWRHSSLGKKNFIVSLSLVLVLLVGAIFQRYFASRYPQLSGWFSQLLANEARYLEIHSLEMTDEFFKQYAVTAQPNVFRVMVIGSSQTWGAGAAEVDGGMVAVMNKLAEKQLKWTNKTYEFIPAAVSGQTAIDLVTLYEQHWYVFKPDLLVVNLSSNDDNEAIFAEMLERFVVFTKRQGIPLVFVLEANAVEHRLAVANHKTMQLVADKYKIPVVDAHTYMASQQHSGILWWDFVHPTSYGHQILGEYIFQNIKHQLTTNK